MYLHRLAAVSGIVAVTGVAARQCQNITVPVALAAQNAVLDVTVPETSIEVTDFVLNLLKSLRDGTTPVPETVNISGDYELATTYCEPDAGPSNILQILTHGIGFDRGYWDFPINQYNYSYVNYAVDHGYSTLSWDRIGLGESSHGDPVNEIQLALEVAALRELTLQARDGGIQGLPATFEKIVHIGHSQGSSYTNALTSMDPNISDGMVLTGFSHVSDYQPWGMISLELNDAHSKPGREDYDHGYLITNSEIGQHMVFFAAGQFDPAVLETAYNAAQPVAIGEMLTTGPPGINNMTGPVAIITGREYHFSSQYKAMTDTNASQRTTLYSVALTATRLAPPTRRLYWTCQSLTIL